MKTIEQRINNIIGQLEGIKRMLANKPEDCFALITQIKAVKSALSALIEKILSSEFDRCFNNKMSLDKKRKMEIIFKELIKK